MDADGRWAGRRVRLPWVAALAVVGVVLGTVLGAWQTRLDAQRSAQADTRLLLWDGDLRASDSNTVGAADFTATGRSLGGPVLVHELRTPYGSVSFSPDIALDPAGGHPLRIRLRPDCSTYGQWQDDLAKAPRTATALVRDLPRDPLRPVPVDLTGDFVVALAFLPCAQQAVNRINPDPTAASSSVVEVIAMTGVPDGEVSLHLQVGSGAGTGRPVTVTAQIAEAYAGLQPATFRIDPAHPFSTLVPPGEVVDLPVGLLYHCGSTPTRVQDPGSVLELTAVDATTGTPVPVVGWAPAEVAIAVAGAAATAGCPISP